MEINNIIINQHDLKLVLSYPKCVSIPLPHHRIDIVFTVNSVILDCCAGLRLSLSAYHVALLPKNLEDRTGMKK